MGGIAQGLHHQYYLNLGNPASFSAISMTTYEVGMNLTLNQF